MKKIIWLVIVSCIALISRAQEPGTGPYPFASFDNRGFDAVNLGNLNTRFTIPIVSRTGRGLPFVYTIQNEGLVWQPVVTGSTTAWTPNPSWGFDGQLNGTGFSGYLSFVQGSVYCTGPPRIPVPQYRSFAYHDRFGAVHPFTYTLTEPCPNGSDGGVTGSGNSSDGSGHKLLDTARVQSRNGVIFVPPQSPSSQTANTTVDPNGNEITFNGTGAFTDTIGATALTIAGSGPVTYTYPVTLQANNATTATTTLTYRQYTVRTNFGCSGIVEYGSNTVNLVDRVTYADGSYYAFTYEGTPGATDGAVTARVASITLPTGGVISYAYSGGCNGSSGINADGTVSGLSRSTTDGTRTYTRATVNSSETSTTMQDEKGNQTVLTFASASGLFYETHRQTHQGTTSGPVLLDLYTCYNGATAPCDGVAITPPLTEVDVVESFNGGSQSLTKNAYNSTSGTLTSTAQYSGTTLLGKATYTYNSLGEVLSSTTTDGSGNTVAASTYGYDETAVTATSGIPQHTAGASTRGNLTSSHINYSGSSALTTTTTYYDTGAPVSTVTPGPQTTQYAYDPTQTFVTQTTLPLPSSGVSLSTSGTYNSGSATVLTATGMNSGQTTSVTQYDSFLRPTAISLPNGGNISVSYSSPVHEVINQTLNTSTGEHAARDLLTDQYGRTSRLAILNGQSVNAWYQEDDCYDQSGLLEFTPTIYQGQGEVTPIRCSGSGTLYKYDALGRVTQISNDDGPTTIIYSNRAVETTDVNNVQRITQFDLLGRIAGVCEISPHSLGSQSPVACGMDISGTGYVTSYAYNLANHTVTITQGSQQRTVQTDEAGRTISVTEPERGVTTYSYTYNSTGLQVVRTRPKANQTSATVYTHTTTQYDSLGRVVSVSYDDGLTPAKDYYYDVVPSSLQWSQSAANPKGRLVATSSGSGTSLTRSEMSYDISGNVVSMWQCAPSICGGASQQTRAISFAYDLGGNLTYEADPTSGVITYSRTPAGEVSSVTSTSSNTTGDPGTLISNVANSPFGATSYSLGNGLTQVATYDTLGRNNGNWVCNGSSVSSCTNGTQLYGSLGTYKGSQIQSGCDTVLNQCQSNGYDEFNRLTAITDLSHNTGDIGSYTYSYDRYGNRLSQTSQSGGPSPNYSFPNNNQIQGLTYDAAGNLLNDGISHSYTYDAEGNVLQVDGGTTAQYVYDASNRRIRVQTQSATNEFTFDPFGQKITTWEASANFGIESRLYLNGKPFAFRALDGTTYFQHRDSLGTERIRTNYLGQLAANESSLPFGDRFQQSGSTYADQDTDEFAGQDYDSESITDHAQFRQYSSTQGRWMSPDPFDGSYDVTNPQSLNRYSYVLNSPLAYLDPTGLYCEYPHGDDAVSDGKPLDDVDYQSPGQAYCENDGGTWFPDGTGAVGGDTGDDSLEGSNSGPGLGGSFGGGGYFGSALSSFLSRALQFERKAISCNIDQLKNYGLATATDVLGAIPVEGQIVASIQLGAAGVGFANSLHSNDALGSAGSIIGGQISLVSLAAMKLGVPLAEEVPGLGNLLSAGFAVKDIIQGTRDDYTCLVGH